MKGHWIIPGLLGGLLAACGGPSAQDPNGSSSPGAGGTPGAGSGVGGADGVSTGSAGGAPSGGTGGDPVVEPPPPFEEVSAFAAVRKVKNLLVGLPPTDEEVATVAEAGASGLKALIDTWTTDPGLQGHFRDKMLFFFRNAFQQTGFTPTEDFKPQLLENGGFDFGPLGYRGDDAFARIVQNLQDSFALTAWALVAEGRPFTEVLTTERFMMTTALKSLYLQIEMPNDQPFAFGFNQEKIPWKIDLSGRDIPLEDTLNPEHPDYMVFSDVPPVTNVRSFVTPTCQGEDRVVEHKGYAQLFQRLLGFTPRYPYVGSPECWEHHSRPYFTTQDLTDWQWVTIRPLKSGEALAKPYDLPTLRKLTELAVNLPRVGFFTTPAFLALWNTNNSNQHRVTANQTLLVALGRSFVPDSVLLPLSPVGLDAEHSVEGSECYGCHKTLDPMRQFWSGHFDFNDRNDFPTSTFFGAVPNPRPAQTGGVFAFGNVNAEGRSIHDVGTFLAQVTDTHDPAQPLKRFAVAFTQKLCYFANSSSCVEGDPEFRRVASAFEASGFLFPTLVRELFSSPLVTGLSGTQTFDTQGMTLSVSRRDHLCAALSNRLGKPDVCALAVPLPSQAQNATLKIAGSIAADAFSRGSEVPVTPSKPTLFYRAATEMLCENVAAQVVDAGAGSVYESSDLTAAIADMVQRIIGYPPSDPKHASAVDILTAHYQAARERPRASATSALRSTFALACQSPTFLSMGL